MRSFACKNQNVGSSASGNKDRPKSQSMYKMVSGFRAFVGDHTHRCRFFQSLQHDQSVESLCGWAQNYAGGQKKRRVDENEFGAHFGRFSATPRRTRFIKTSERWPPLLCTGSVGYIVTIYRSTDKMLMQK